MEIVLLISWVALIIATKIASVRVLAKIGLL